MKKRGFDLIGILISIALIAISFGYWYGYDQTISISKQMSDLSSQIVSLELKFASTTAMLEKSIEGTETSFSDALIKEKENVTKIQKQFGDFQEEVGAISGTVTTLEKLSNTDSELLLKYSKIFFLNEYYNPLRLTEIPNEYKYHEEKNLQLDSQVWSYLWSMLGQALQEDVEIFVFSSYRSFGTQSTLKNQYTVRYGEGTANQFSADQGYSEHQLGTTVDLIARGIDGTLPGFDTTDAYTWLLGNAHKYGFILSYPKDNSFYVFEPWHWRFVGVKLATDLYNTNRTFYELDQREIDKYLISIFD